MISKNFDTIVESISNGNDGYETCVDIKACLSKNKTKLMYDLSEYKNHSINVSSGDVKVREPVNFNCKGCIVVSLQIYLTIVLNGSQV